MKNVFCSNTPSDPLPSKFFYCIPPKTFPSKFYVFSSLPALKPIKSIQCYLYNALALYSAFAGAWAASRNHIFKENLLSLSRSHLWLIASQVRLHESLSCWYWDLGLARPCIGVVHAVPAIVSLRAQWLSFPANKVPLHVSSTTFGSYNLSAPFTAMISGTYFEAGLSMILKHSHLPRQLSNVWYPGVVLSWPPQYPCYRHLQLCHLANWVTSSATLALHDNFFLLWYFLFTRAMLFPAVLELLATVTLLP